MAWLVCDGRVLASVELAASVRDRTKGLLGRDGIDGAILLTPARSVHTLRMTFPIDVAFLDQDRRVVRVVMMKPNRVSRLVWPSRSVVEAEAGAFERWGIAVGDVLEIREGESG